MKFATIVYVATVLASSAYAGPSEPTPNAQAVNDYCNQPGGQCTKLKRAADAAAAALAMPDAEPWQRFCHLPGQGCWKAKRSIDALAEAVKSAYVSADFDPAAAAGKFPILQPYIRPLNLMLTSLRNRS